MAAPTSFGAFRERYENPQHCAQETMALGGGDTSCPRGSWCTKLLWPEGSRTSETFAVGPRAHSSVTGGSGTSAWCAHLQSLTKQSDAAVEGTPDPLGWPLLGLLNRQDVSSAACHCPRPGGGCRPQRGWLQTTAGVAPSRGTESGEAETRRSENPARQTPLPALPPGPGPPPASWSALTLLRTWPCSIWVSQCASSMVSCLWVAWG